MKLKLGAVSGMSKKKLCVWLAEAARDVNCAKNSMLWYWMQWRREHPDWQPQQRVDRKGQPKCKANGEPAMEQASCSQQLAREMYGLGRKTAPRVNSKVISQAWTALCQRLTDNVPYNHEGPSRFVWQALLNFERSLDCYRSQTVPVPSQDSCLRYDGCNSRQLSTGIMARLTDYAQNNAAIRVPLWSRESGHNVVDVICRIDIAKMTKGHRALLRRIAAGEIKFSDSELVGRDGQWFLHLVYEMPTFNHGVDVSKVVTLSMGAGHSFLLSFPDGYTRRIGDDKPLAAEARRLRERKRLINDKHAELVEKKLGAEVLRKTLRYRSRHGQGRGHGKGAFYAKLRPSSRRFLDMQDEFGNQVRAEIVRQMTFSDRLCGKLVYREPTMPLREKSWFADQGLPFNWTEFLAGLKFKLGQHGIELEVKRMGMKEWMNANQRKTKEKVH